MHVVKGKAIESAQYLLDLVPYFISHQSHNNSWYTGVSKFNLDKS